MSNNKIIQSSTWPRQWLEEQAVVLSKLKAQQVPQNEDDLRTVSKTAWFSKCFENLLGDYILPIIDKYIDPGQCGGLKKSSVSHYLIKLLDFAHRTLDKNTPHCAVLCTEDLSKAYNRGSHNLVIEDLWAMHLPGWLSALIPITRPITQNKGMQVKFIDDASQIASVNLKKSLIPDTQVRPRPLNYSERTEMILNPTEDVLQQELEKFFLFRCASISG